MRRSGGSVRMRPLTGKAVARLDTAIALRRSGGHLAWRRAGRLARRMARWPGHTTWKFGCWSGRQDAALYVRQGCLTLRGGGVRISARKQSGLADRSAVAAQAQDTLLAVDEDADGIGFDFQAADADGTRNSGH